MYVSAERLAIADREVVEIFEQTSIAWQAIPNWTTGDPGQSRVRDDVVNNPRFLDLVLRSVGFQASLAQLGAPTPDSLLAEVMASTTRLANQLDWVVFEKLLAVAQTEAITADATANDLANSLIDARARVEDAGYRAPSCLITNTRGLKLLNAFADGSSALGSILTSANVNSLHRTSLFGVPDPGAESESGSTKASATKPTMILIGRRQRIADGAASDASPGEEPVDIAVSQPPTLEILGEHSEGGIEMGVRVRFAPRIKDPSGVVVLRAS